jgi:hypothetical protein
MRIVTVCRASSVRRNIASVLAIASAVALPGAVGAQMLGVPVLQNGFTNPGITLAVNYGSAEKVRGYGAAAAWAPATGRFQVSGGIGGYDADEGKSLTTYGGRFAMPLTRFTGTGNLGVAPFAGIGAASREGVSIMHIPVGVAAGYRRGLGATRAISVYGSSFYGFTRTTNDAASDESDSKGLLRFSVGLDVTVIPALGLTLGYELGANAGDGEPGPRSSIFGIGLSYALRR